MPQSIRIEATRAVAAPADQVYAVLADYHVGHPSILPARAFVGLTVEKGGRGAGTVIKFGMKSFGTVRWARAAVDEPEPGRVLRERTLDEKDIVTTFTVDPLEGGRSQVTIETTWAPRGLSGLFERLLAPRFLARVYAEELGNLDAAVGGGGGSRNGADR